MCVCGADIGQSAGWRRGGHGRRHASPDRIGRSDRACRLRSSPSYPARRRVMSYLAAWDDARSCPHRLRSNERGRLAGRRLAAGARGGSMTRVVHRRSARRYKSLRCGCGHIARPIVLACPAPPLMQACLGIGRDVTGVQPARFLIERRGLELQVAPSRASKNTNLAQWLPEWAGYTEGG